MAKVYDNANDLITFARSSGGTSLRRVGYGENLVTNGDFATGDLTGWTTQSGASVFTVSSGQLTISRSAVDPGYVYQVISTSSGGVYAVTFDIIDDGPIDLRVGTSPAGLQIMSSGIYTSSGTYTHYFVATGATTHVSFVNTSYSVATTIDNISVREINPLSVSIQMDGRMTYADEDTDDTADGDGAEIDFVRWKVDATNFISSHLVTNGTKTGEIIFDQRETSSLFDLSREETDGSYTPGINVPFNIASRHGSTFIRGATDGVLTNLNTTPTALPDLSSTNLQIAYDFMGTIGTFRQFAGDIGDTGLVTATNPSTEPTLSLTFDGTDGSFYNLNWSE